jgi:serine protease inhibitor
VVADRPFLFAIVDNATGLPLFLGQVSHPRSG